MAVDSMELSQFTVVDYVIFSLTLVVSLGIGIYHGIRGNKTTEDFLLANRSLSPVPAACSLIATYISAISILGFSAEAYAYGLQMYWVVPGVITGLLLNIYIILPVFFGLKLDSINEYMVVRFKSRALKIMMLATTCLKDLLLLGVVLYSPTLALAAITPISSDTYILIMGFVVTLYSSLGGLKAVIWTDFFQTGIIIVCIILITASSLSTAGGVANVWRIAGENGRLDAFDMGFGMYKRHTAINCFIMGIFTYGYIFSFTQQSLQRTTTQSSLKTSQRIMYANLVATLIVFTALFLAGISIYAVYHGCDPISLRFIEKKDQIMSFYVMHHLGSLRGVPGLFVACLFSGALSTASSLLNAIPTMIWLDILVDIQYFKRASETSRMIFNKLFTVVLGIAVTGMAFLASRSHGVIQTTIALSGTLGGPLCGVFVLGIAVPIVGKKGAIAGFLISLTLMTWIGFGAQLHGEATPMLPLHTDLCEGSSNLTLASHVTTELPHVILDTGRHHPMWPVYNISYTLFSSLGVIICLIAAFLVTLCTGCENLANVNPQHVAHFWRCKVGPKSRRFSDKPTEESENECLALEGHIRPTLQN